MAIHFCGSGAWVETPQQPEILVLPERESQDYDRKKIHRSLILTGSGIIILLFGLTRWLVHLAMGGGAAPSKNLLPSELLGYGAMNLVLVVACRAMKLSQGINSNPGRAWFSFSLIGLAVAVLIVRFFIKQPPSHWSENTEAEWRATMESYLVGRLAVPLAEKWYSEGFCGLVL